VQLFIQKDHVWKLLKWINVLESHQAKVSVPTFLPVFRVWDFWTPYTIWKAKKSSEHCKIKNKPPCRGAFPLRKLMSPISHRSPKKLLISILLILIILIQIWPSRFSEKWTIKVHMTTFMAKNQKLKITLSSWNRKSLETSLIRSILLKRGSNFLKIG